MVYKLFASSAFLILAGCVGSLDRGGIDTKDVKRYQALGPVDALVAMSSQYDETYKVYRADQTADIYVSPSSVLKVINMSRYYCGSREGRVSDWPGERGSYNCVNSKGEIDYSISLFYGIGRVTVLERTMENADIYNAQLGAMGYFSPEQVLVKKKLKQQIIEAERNREQERLLGMRLRDREKVSHIGAVVCQPSSYRGAPMVLLGTVEQVAEDRLKVFFERAILPRTPALSPGGFKQHYSWVDFLDVEPCHLNVQ